MPEILKKSQILHEVLLVRRGLCFVQTSHCSDEAEDCIAQMPENATQWIWEKSDIIGNRGMHDFRYNKWVLLCTYHPIKVMR